MTYNIEVKSRAGENADKLVKRFIKKCKKEDIVKEYLEKTSYALTKSQKKRAKRLKNRFLRQKESVKLEKAKYYSF